jgi:hypothetical protein
VITRLERLIGDLWVIDLNDEPPFSLRMLIKARRRGEVC